MMNKNLFLNLFISAISFTAIAMDGGRIAKTKGSGKLVSSTSKYGSFKSISWSVQDKGREEFRKRSNSGAFIADRSKERTQNMEKRKNESQIKLDLHIPEFRQKGQTVSHVTVRKKRSNSCITPAELDKTKREYEKRQENAMLNFLDIEESARLKKSVFKPVTSPDSPVFVKFIFDIAINNQDIAGAIKILRENPELAEAYYPARIFKDVYKGKTNIDEFYVDKNRLEPAINKEAFDNAILTFASPSLVNKVQYDNAVNSRDIAKVISLGDSDELLRETYPAAAFLDSVFNHFAYEKEHFYVNPAKIEPAINIQALEDVAFELAKKGDNVAFLEACAEHPRLSKKIVLN